ncbi:MAG: hypothetical protein KJ749_04910 [Planctomycetes bacterium]|nr:hypothetical protein [Planctomycetota bacterium]
MSVNQKDRPHAGRSEYTPLVIGLAGVGRQVALQPTALGVEHLQLVDSKLVRRTQRIIAGYFAEDAGRRRQHATAELCHRLQPQLAMHTVARVVCACSLDQRAFRQGTPSVIAC